ncbi:hypothetical protein FB451DRAFT_1477449 [Mycena latifolia]|nr:hypothetical protein FB451DRAFT_1477449 [Mycena latifolia]
MHRCLAIPELVRLVATHLHSSDCPEMNYMVRQPTRRDLAAMTTTCAAFHALTVDLLWTSAPLMNLLRCFPSDLVEITKGHVLRYTMRLLRGIKLSSVFPSIGVCLPDNMLLNLVSLHWIHQDDSFPYIRHLLGPQITTIRIPFLSLPAVSLLSTLALECPKLKNVTVFQGPPTSRDVVDEAQASNAVSTLVCGSQFIEAITTHRLNEEALEHLRRLPNLHHLDLGALPAALRVPPIGDPDPFISLRTVYFSSELETATRFLGWFTRVGLTNFRVTVPAFATADQTHHFCTAVAAGLSHSSLTELALDNDYDDFEMLLSAQYYIRPNSVRMLFRFANLTSVSILSPVGIDLDNETVTEMAGAWRRIEFLALSSYYSPIPRSRVTLQCLAIFARYCSHLRRLSITFDGTIIPPLQTVAGNRLPQNSLEYLDVEHSPIDAPISVARFISGIFSRLDEIRTTRDNEDNQDPDELMRNAEAIENHRRWKEVEALVPDLVEIRAEERANMASTGDF